MGKKRLSREEMDRLINMYLPEPDLISEQELSAGEHNRERTHPRRWPVDATLDLHGFTLEEAKARTEAFIARCRTAGMKKVLIIHGKGKHSSSEGVLKREMTIYLRQHRDTGMMGIPDRSMGGSGAVWVVIRQRSR